jgi:four helix bundle protein
MPAISTAEPARRQSAESKAQEHMSERSHWRFEDLEIWRMARDLAVQFHLVADGLEKRKFYRYAEQLRGAGLSLSNNIAEGSGSVHRQEFIQFLNIARRSLFEDVSMLFVFEKLGLLQADNVTELVNACDKLSRKITNFSRIL